MKEIINCNGHITSIELNEVDTCLAVKQQEFIEFMSFKEFVDFLTNLTSLAYNPDKGRRLDITRLDKAGGGTSVVFSLHRDKGDRVVQIHVSPSGDAKGSFVVYDDKWLFAVTTRAVENQLVVMTKPVGDKKVAAAIYVFELALSLAPFIQHCNIVPSTPCKNN